MLPCHFLPEVSFSHPKIIFLFLTNYCSLCFFLAHLDSSVFPSLLTIFLQLGMNSVRAEIFDCYLPPLLNPWNLPQCLEIGKICGMNVSGTESENLRAVFLSAWKRVSLKGVVKRGSGV